MTKQEKSAKLVILCHICGKMCSGEVLKVQDKHFHIDCFTCTECHASLVSGGYFVKNNSYYCKKDYQKLYGIKCAKCNGFIDGMLAKAMGQSYHPHCLSCVKCKNPITTGAVLTPYDKEIVCRTCANKLVPASRSSLPSHATSTLAYMSEQRKSLSPPSVISPYSTLSSSSNISNTSSSSNGPLSPGASAQSHNSGRHRASPSSSATSAVNNSSSTSAYGKRRSASDIDILEKDNSSSSRRQTVSSGLRSQAPTVSSSMYSLGSTPSYLMEDQKSFSFEQKAVPEMSSAYTAITETDGQLKLKPVEPQVKAKLGLCAGCKELIPKSGTSLLALNQHWHMWCLKCHKCNRLVSEEFVGMEENPYCEACYGKLFGFACSACNKPIIGRGLQAASQAFHTDCARCSKCGHYFNEDEDMCVLGTEVWHLSCERYLAQMQAGNMPQRDQSNPSRSRSSPAASRDYSSQRNSEKSPSSPASSGKVTANGSEAKKEPQSKVSSVSPKSEKAKSSDAPLGKFARSDSCSVSEAIKAFSQSSDKEGPNGSSPSLTRSSPPKPRSDSQSSTDTQSGDSTSRASAEPAVIYPLELLQTRGGTSKLPKGADRARLEQHLTDEDFQVAFSMSRDTFTALPKWKKIELKKKAHLF